MSLLREDWTPHTGVLQVESSEFNIPPYKLHLTGQHVCNSPDSASHLNNLMLEGCIQINPLRIAGAIPLTLDHKANPTLLNTLSGCRSRRAPPRQGLQTPAAHRRGG